MKKFLALCFALSVSLLFAQAQITDNFESYSPFTVDPVGIWTYYDGDGGETYNYENVTVSNLPYTGSCIVMNPSLTDPDITETQGAHGGSQFLAIFNSVPSTITNGTTTNDWLISPEMPFTNGGTLTFWARELTDQYGSEVMRVLYSASNNNPSSFAELQQVNISSTSWTQYSYSIPAGAKYVAINCISNDIFALFIDDISLQVNTAEATIVTVPNTIDFGSVGINEAVTSIVNITGLNLTSNITATASAPFSVSSNGSNFSTSATIPSSGGTLFVRYTPTTTGVDNGTVSLTSGTAAASVTLLGNAIDCSRTVPYTCTFAGGSDELLCWETLDLNGDADAEHHGEFFFNGDFDPDNDDGIAQYFFNANSAANDWLISPPIILGLNSHAAFDYRIASSSYPEIFGVYVIPQGGSYLTATAVIAQHSVSNTDWVTQDIDLATYNNQTIRLAIHVTSAADMWWIAFDNFRVDGDLSSTLTANVASIDFGSIPVDTLKDEVAILNSTNLNEAITVSTTAPFSVSMDGVNFSTTLTIPANPTFNVDDMLYVRFDPEEATSYTGELTATTSTLSANITLIGNAVPVDTTGITDFDNAISIYPNPATTVLNVKAEGYNTIELVNVVGQVVYSANITGHMQINVSDLKNGVYFIRLNGEKGSVTQKFIKR